MRLNEYSNNELIAELEARGFTVFNEEEAVENEVELAAGETLVTLVLALSAALENEDDHLVNKLLEALIFCATGEPVTISNDEEADAA